MGMVGMSSMLGKAIGKAIAKQFVEKPQRIKVPDPQKILEHMSHQRHLDLSELYEVLYAAKTPRSVNEIIKYLKSDAASNLTLWQRGKMIHECFDKIDILHTIQSLLH
ncbi:SAM-dependent MidA family methyltransferase [Alicyclobacillus cycloheptanicus]|uniref:SAM-dependent MidA family methyltransferase n=1 Tax=Alicyclobacillus cycloheptanicus TaxID=1457 RepID=A0ABT9XD83_9BACL|nr:SAM-dependent MidA family methyltransferase [Alicyclobacillus cycloheptanicus]